MVYLKVLEVNLDTGDKFKSLVAAQRPTTLDLSDLFPILPRTLRAEIFGGYA